MFPPCRQRVKDYDAWCVNPASEEFASEGLCSLSAANRSGITTYGTSNRQLKHKFVLADVIRPFLGDLCVGFKGKRSFVPWITEPSSTL